MGTGVERVGRGRGGGGRGDDERISRHGALLGN